MFQIWVIWCQIYRIKKKMFNVYDIFASVVSSVVFVLLAFECIILDQGEEKLTTKQSRWFLLCSLIVGSVVGYLIFSGQQRGLVYPAREWIYDLKQLDNRVLKCTEALYSATPQESEDKNLARLLELAKETRAIATAVIERDPVATNVTVHIVKDTFWREKIATINISLLSTVLALKEELHHRTKIPIDRLFLYKGWSPLTASDDCKLYTWEINDGCTIFVSENPVADS